MLLLRSFFTIGGLTMVSRVLGLLRDILIAAMVGAGMVADCFFVAFKLPNFFRRLFAEGAFNAAFVPLYSGQLPKGETTGPLQPNPQAQDFANQILSVFVPILLLGVSLMQAGMPWVMMGLAPGFIGDPEKFALAVTFTRITFPYLLFISLVSLMGGVLNSLGRFAAMAATPILLNIILIGALILLGPHLPTGGHALAWGVTLGGVIQFVWLMAHCRRAGVDLHLSWPRFTPAVKDLVTLIIPAALGAGIVQVNLFLDIVIASFLPSGSLSFLYYADRINQLPLGVVGVAAGTALLPLLSRQVASGEDAAAQASQNRAIEFVLVLTIPAAVALLVVPGPIISVIFQRGAFGANEAAATAAALAAYAAGLPAYVLVKVLGPGFFARKDTRTPVRFAIIAVAVNLVLNITLMQWFQHVGLALATAISSWVNVYLMTRELWRRGHLKMDARLRARLPRVILASALMAGVLWVAASRLSAFFDAGAVARISALAALIGLGIAAFLGVALAIRAIRFSDVAPLLKRRPRNGG